MDITPQCTTTPTRGLHGPRHRSWGREATRAIDTELCHPAEQGGVLQAQTCRGAVGPATTQLVVRRASRICASIASSSVADIVATGEARRTPALLVGTCGRSTPLAARMTPRSMTFCNSPTLPGQS